MLSIEGLDFAYPGGPFRLRVDRLAVARGERVALVGPSGAGKTTLLHLVAGIERPRAGRIEVDGRAMSTLTDAQRRAFRIARIGLVFQELELLEHLDVLDNVLLCYRISGALTLDRAARERALELAEEVGIADKLRRLPRRLSQGERQRVAVCRALVTEPALVLADEPTASLDPAQRDRVLALLLERTARTGATLLAVTHDAELAPRFERVLDAREWA